MKTFLISLVMTSQAIFGVSFAQTGTSTEAPPKAAMPASAPLPDAQPPVVGRWSGSLYGKNTGTHMSDDEIVITQGAAPDKLRIEYSGISRFKDTYNEKYEFPPVETSPVDGSVRFEAGRFTLDCKQEGTDKLRCSKVLADGRGNQGSFKRVTK